MFGFRVIARGARGGKGADGMGISKGATSIAVVEMIKHQQLYILVGQEGGDACRKVRARLRTVYSAAALKLRDSNLRAHLIMNKTQILLFINL